MGKVDISRALQIVPDPSDIIHYSALQLLDRFKATHLPDPLDEDDFDILKIDISLKTDQVRLYR